MRLREETYTTQKQAIPRITCSIPSSELMQAKRVLVLQQPISTALEGIIMMFPTAQTPLTLPRRM